ncbi:MAG: DNA mismatch repair endonuclease MutL [Christensenellales bacterium]|jgi:DNA mismatch repair protein MutL
MGKIRVLPMEVANQIAAGEVVERPASIVKELIENAVDAGSSAISVEMRGGGIEFLRVTDNGAGMDAQDAALAFQRHATSKIATGEDLHRISTMGFRGEALSSIAAVAKVELTTCRRGEPFGTKIVIEGGEVLSQEEIGCPEGTTLIVRDLFYNVPARRKFLKRENVESSYVSDAVLQAILSYPEVSIRLSSQGRTVYHSPGNGKLEDAVFSVYGREVVGHLIPLQEVSENGVTFSGVLGGPELARPHRRRQHVQINRRPVRSFALASAVEAAYDTRLMVHKFPFFVLNVQMPPQEVDVNVHPNKLEVRLHNERALRSRITVLCAAALEGRRDNVLSGAQNIDQAHDVPPPAQEDVSPEPPAARVKSTVLSGDRPRIDMEDFQVIPAPAGLIRQGSAPISWDVVGSVFTQMDQAQRRRGEEIPPRSAPPPQSDTSFAHELAPEPQQEMLPEETLEETPYYRVLGQAFDTYLILQIGGELLFIDQHAAHERLLFDEYEAQLKAARMVTQPLLVPHIVHLSASEMVLYLDNADVFADLGFTVEEFGAMTLQVREVPMVLGEPQLDAFFQETLSALSDARQVSTADLKRYAVMSAACKAAIKAGDALSRGEMDALVQRIGRQTTPMHCPHGRPVYFKMTQYELERRFKRV